MGAIGPLELVVVLAGAAITWVFSTKRFQASKTIVRVAVVSVALIAVVIAATGQRPRTDTPEETSLPSETGFLEPNLRGFAAGFNQSLPLPVDGSTMLESISVDGKTIIYHYTIATDSTYSPDISEIERRFKPGHLEKACRSPEIEDLLAQDAVIRHRYTDQSGESLGDIFITIPDCK